MVQKGLLTANQHTPMNQVGFGHLFYTKRKFSYYIIRAEYKFPTDAASPGFPSWTNQNNGLMLHGQDPASIGLSGTYPTSLEVQLLGPKSTALGASTSDWPVGSTGNLCLVNSIVFWKGADIDPNKNHCTASQYPAEWKETRIPWDQELFPEVHP